MPQRHAVKKPGFEAWSYSDDCAGMTGAPDDEYLIGRGELCNLVVDDKVVGQCRMNFEGGSWAFEVFLLPGHTMRAQPRRAPPDEP